MRKLGLQFRPIHKYITFLEQNKAHIKYKNNRKYCNIDNLHAALINGCLKYQKEKNKAYTDVLTFHLHFPSKINCQTGTETTFRSNGGFKKKSEQEINLKSYYTTITTLTDRFRDNKHYSEKT